jgi:hypothetical protein
MALDNLAGLKASALAWVERVGDPAAETIVGDCVTLCESRINKNADFRLPEMETEATLTLTDGSAALPNDFLAMHRVVANASTPRLLSYVEPGWFQDMHLGGGNAGESGFYTLIGSTLRAQSSSTIGIVYYAKVPALATTDPNWLLLKSPDVYLYGTILEMLIALEGDAQDKYAGLFSAAVEGLIQSETYSRGGVLTQRASMPAP